MKHKNVDTIRRLCQWVGGALCALLMIGILCVVAEATTQSTLRQSFEGQAVYSPQSTGNVILTNVVRKDLSRRFFVELRSPQNDVFNDLDSTLPLSIPLNNSLSINILHEKWDGLEGSAQTTLLTLPEDSSVIDLGEIIVEQKKPDEDVPETEGAEDELTILTLHSSPQQGENWEVSFTTRGTADLTIIPNDQATIDDDEFVALTCDGQERTPQILVGDIIYYSKWQCAGISKVIHYTKKAGNHTLRFEFGDQTAFAYNISGYSYRKKITVQSAYIDSNLTDFPLYVDITSDLDIGAGMTDTTNYYDIRFTDENGVVLSYEEESMSIASQVATGHYWVKTDLDSSSGATLFVYYGKSGATDGSNAAAVWDTSYKMVLHFTETSGTLYDSTAEGNNATNTGADSTSSGAVYNAYNFVTANSDYMVADSVTADIASTDSTTTAWIKTTSHTTSWGALTSYNTSTGDNRLLSGVNTNEYQVHDGAWITSGTAVVNDGTWHHVAMLLDTATDVSTYVDGEIDINQDALTLNIASNDKFSIGAEWDTDSQSDFFNGTIDEVRVSDTLRSADWIKFEYRNMYETDNELTWDIQENLETPPPGAFIPGESYRGGINDGYDHGKSEVESAGANDDTPSYLTFADVTEDAYGVPDTPTAVNFSPQPIILLMDAQGNTLGYNDGDRAGTDEVNLTLDFRSNPNASLAGTVSKSFTNGVANFSGRGLHIDRPGVYRLKATAILHGKSVTGESSFFEIYTNTLEFIDF